MVRPMRVVLVFFVWCSVAVPAWAVEEQCQAFGVNAQLPALTNPRLERGTTLLCNLGYAALVSTVSHGPLWAAEHLRANDLAAAADLPRKGHFYADPRWPGGAALSDYRRTKPYDRGHMAPSGDQPTLQAQQETYALSNIVPQASVLNKGIWARMEHKVRLLAEREGELYVVTGPAFHLRPIATQGHDHVYVPSSVWKAVYSPTRGRAGVYVCKNRPVHPHCDQVSVQTLIRNTGVDPFPAVPAQVKAQVWHLPSP
ncbi:MAG: DNA/RNA non-specific endonuclease [Acetobacter fabarum]|uniref:DNA/RNA non-specific endonuclease n=1 Tax=Acetobacter fabarum TaxID=483199 RepID=UPI0039E7D0F0